MPISGITFNNSKNPKLESKENKTFEQVEFNSKELLPTNSAIF